MLTRLRQLVRSAPVIIGIATILMLGTVSTLDDWRRMELKGFDLLMVTTAPGKSTLPIAIVGVDETSFAQIGKQWPWPRSTHAKLVEQLNRAGALVIVFDLPFSDTSNEAEDRQFAEAIGKAGNVVLTSDLVFQETQFVRQWVRVEPLAAFKVAGAADGLASISRDSDLVLRQLPDGRDVLWREILRRVNLLRPGLIEEPSSLAGKMIGYIGPDHTFPYVHYYQALQADTDLPPDYFRDQIVIVGRDVKSATETGGNEDNFATPFTSWTGFLTPGAELHANILESAVSRRHLAPLRWGWNFAILAFAVAASVLLMRRWRPFLSGLAGLALLSAIVAADWLLFAYFNLWLAPLAAMIGVAIVYSALGTHAYFSERRERQETRRAFSMYLAPAVVDTIMAHPEKLQLGGERSEVTLLFTDLAGFTNISEQLGPEQVAQLLNEHFSRATTIIKQYGGTVNSFIGDAIMAMWGAPINDPKHALNACLAARDMQLDMQQLRAELYRRGLPPLAMRVGINTGQAIVGNLGALERFNYGAIGDSVNLAARLEGINKLYGTEILLSASTATQLDGALLLRQVDRVIVKGKTEVIDIYTISDHLEVNQLSAAALQAYQYKDWDKSETLWHQLLALNPTDKISRLFLDRIGELRQEPPPAGWVGEVALEKY